MNCSCYQRLAAVECDDTFVRGRDYYGCRGHAGDLEGADRRVICSGRGGSTPFGRRRMSARDGLIIALPENEGGEPLWTRIVDGAVVQEGAGINWLAACGLAALPKDCVVMLVPPASLTVLHWISYPDLPVRQGRAAARLAAMAGGVASADSLFAATDRNDDPARPHLVAITARRDMQRSEEHTSELQSLMRPSYAVF